MKMHKKKIKMLANPIRSAASDLKGYVLLYSSSNHTPFILSDSDIVVLNSLISSSVNSSRNFYINGSAAPARIIDEPVRNPRRTAPLTKEQIRKRQVDRYAEANRERAVRFGKIGRASCRERV